MANERLVWARLALAWTAKPQATHRRCSSRSRACRAPCGLRFRRHDRTRGRRLFFARSATVNSIARAIGIRATPLFLSIQP